MQKMSAVLITSCAVMLAGCVAAVSPMVKEKHNVQSEAYQYPENPDLSPLSQAIYTTIKASANDFRDMTGEPMPESRKRKYVDELADLILMQSIRREGAVSAIESYRNSDFHEADLGDLFAGTGYRPEEQGVTHGLQLLAHHTQSQIWYLLPTDDKADAKRLAGRIAEELESTVMPEPKGWRWLNKEEQFARDMKYMEDMREVGEGTEREEQLNRNADEMEAKYREKKREGGYDSHSTTYQWYPGAIDLKTSRLTHVTLAYEDNGVQVRIGRSSPVSQ